MGKIGGFLSRFWRDGSGISSSEYALLTAVVAIGVILAVDQLSNGVSVTMDKAADCLDRTILPQNCK